MLESKVQDVGDTHSVWEPLHRNNPHEYWPFVRPGRYAAVTQRYNPLRFATISTGRRFLTSSSGAHDCTSMHMTAHLAHVAARLMHTYRTPTVQEPQSGHFFSSDWFDLARSSAVWFGSGSEGRVVQKMHSRTTMRRLTPNQNLPRYDTYHRSPFYP